MELAPLNHRARWTTSEFNQLVREVNKGLSYENIANLHHRTIGAIKYKLIRWAIDLAEEDQSLSLKQLCDITTLNKEDLLYGFEKLKFECDYLLQKEEEEEIKVIQEKPKIDVDENKGECEGNLVVSMLDEINIKLNIIMFFLSIWSIDKVLKYSVFYWKKD